MPNPTLSQTPPTKTERRLEELRALSAELEIEGHKLTTAIISEKFSISRRHAQRYLNRLESTITNENSMEKMARSILDVVPLMTKVLKEDLQSIEAISGDSQEERLALVKIRRDQVLALARVSSQFLKELRDLGLSAKSLGFGEDDSDSADNAMGALSPELQAEIDKLADEELGAFERELE